VGEHGHVAAVDLVGGRAHPLGRGPLQLGVDGAVVAGHDVPARLGAPGDTGCVVREQVRGRREVGGPYDLLLVGGQVSGEARGKGIALNLRGRSTKDLDVIAESAEVLARSPRPVLRAFGAEAYGRTLLAAGSRRDGVAWLDRAWDEYLRMGAWALRADVQRAMRDAGARKPKWTGVHPRPPRAGPP